MMGMMRRTIQQGAHCSGFEILETIDLPEFEARGVYARHAAGGAEVFHLCNDDPENLFAFVFATAAGDSTGVAHILEHSVLCGSRNYPLKDPFIILAQGSLKTYLNAWTYPDKTVYPASSVNETDYFNLMSVYGDAVFWPKLDEWIFRQEGWRYQRGGAGGGLSLTGVVYNEMKGAYSSFDEYTQNWMIKSVMPDTIYAFDSGGDPQYIPDLSYEAFLRFHQEKYAPANAKIFLAGNIDTEKQLAFLNERFFSKLAPGRAAPPLPLARRWQKPERRTVRAPADAEAKAMVFVSWLCDTEAREKPAAFVELYALTEALLGHDGSPLVRALIESGLGEDLAPVCGLEAELREPVWAAGLRGVKREAAPEAVEELILSELRRLAKEGIGATEIEAAILSLEFSNREIKRSDGPWSLTLLRRALHGWIHGARPWETMVFERPFAALKEALARDGRYLERRIERTLLENPHRALVTVRPDEHFLAEEDEKRARKIAAFESSLSRTERSLLDKKNRDLEKKQGKADTPGMLRKIPHLRVCDLDSRVDTVPRSLWNAGGVPVVSHRLWTNGISYINLAFPADLLDEEDCLCLPLFCHCAAALGVPGMDYAEVSSLLARTVGDFAALPYVSSAAAGERAVQTPAGVFEITGRDWVFFRLKCLDEKIEAALELALRVMREADFTDERRLRDLIAELKNESDASLAPYGSFYAQSRAARFANPCRAKSEALFGLTQFQWIRQAAALPAAEIGARLTKVREKLFSTAGVVVHLCGEAEDRALALIGKHAASFGPPRPKPAQGAGGGFQEALSEGEAEAEVFYAPALQVGFAAMHLDARDYLDAASPFEQELAHHLSTGALWETIRMKGGAYGARAGVDALERCWSFSTYRDPQPERSLELFPEILKKAGKMKLDADTLEKVIIGAYSKTKQPRSAAQNAAYDFSLFLAGITEEMRQKRLKTLLSARPGDISGAAKRLAAGDPARRRRVIIADEAAAKRAARAWGVRARSLGPSESGAD
jgi:Zn-dependent M16 (insulinase) family peptidase